MHLRECCECCKCCNKCFRECCLCLHPVFGHPAGCLTEILLCPNRTENEPHTLCWYCVSKLKTQVRTDTWVFKCPLCRSKCVFAEDTLPDTGRMCTNICVKCNTQIDEFGPRVVSNSLTAVCVKCEGTYNDVINEMPLKSVKIVYGSGLLGTYTGDTNSDGQRHGEGVFEWPDGTKYEGRWVQGARCGSGKITYADGVIYEGEWKNGLTHGEGAMTDGVGNIHRGHFECGMKQGDGFHTYPSGTYQGTFHQDEKHGHGLQTGSSDNSTYLGEFAHGKFEGMGVLSGPSLGITYEGAFKRGFTEGVGTVTYLDGTSYAGEWKNGRRHGHGVQTLTHGYSNLGRTICSASFPYDTVYYGGKYEGEWMYDKREGYGVEISGNWVKYSGFWKAGKKHGEGILTRNGDTCKGQWADDQRVGVFVETYTNGDQCVRKPDNAHDVYTWANGDVYEGGWRNLKFNGFGTHTLIDGRKYEGVWKKGRRHGWMKTTGRNGMVHEGRWWKDVCVSNIFRLWYVSYKNVQ